MMPKIHNLMEFLSLLVTQPPHTQFTPFHPLQNVSCSFPLICFYEFIFHIKNRGQQKKIGLIISSHPSLLVSPITPQEAPLFISRAKPSTQTAMHEVLLDLNSFFSCLSVFKNVLHFLLKCFLHSIFSTEVTFYTMDISLMYLSQATSCLMCASPMKSFLQ